MKRRLMRASAMCALPLVAMFPVAHAQTDVVTKVNPDPDPNKGRASSYWTPERFRAAKPLPMPVVKSGTNIQSKEAPDTKPSNRPASSDARAPAEEPAPAVEPAYPRKTLPRDAIPKQDN